MASETLAQPMSNEKHASKSEDEIQELTSSTERDDLGNASAETKAEGEDIPEFSDNQQRESTELEGTTVATNPESGYPTGIRFVLLTISLMLGTYMVALDTNIICTHPLPQPKHKHH